VSDLEILTKAEVLDLIRKKGNKFTSNSAYADHLGVYRPQMSSALLDKCPPAPAILKDIGVKRVVLYVRGKVPTRYLDGSTPL
jgi:hypothetical protein